jgi:hypothetical protein
MGTREDINSVLPRGLNQEQACQYLGLKRRTFEALKPQLRALKLGTSLVYDRRELDELFDRLMGEAHPVNLPGHQHKPPTGHPHPTISNGPAGGATSPSGLIPFQGAPWRDKAVSIKTPSAGESTRSSGVSAFRAVSTRIRKQNHGC